MLQPASASGGSWVMAGCGNQTNPASSTMPRKRARRATDEVFSSTMQVTAMQAFVWVHVKTTDGVDPRIDPRPALVLIGTLDEPIRDVHAITLHIHPDEDTRAGPNRPFGVGAITQLRPQVTATVGMPHRDFDRVWGLALHDKLTHARIAFTKPRYTSATLLSVSFSNVVDE